MKLTNKQWSAIATAIVTALGAIIAAVFASCGVTKAYIKQPREGSSTTITITTNNPLSTEVNTSTDADVLNKPSN